MLLKTETLQERFNNLLVSFESKNYCWYFAGQSFSLIGTWMQNIAMSWLVYRLTGSVFLLGVVGFASQIPSFFFSPFAGVITDKYNRKNIMIGAQILFMLQALLLGILTLTGLIQVWHIIVLSLAFGFITVFDTPARQSLVVDLVKDRKNLGNAIALNSAMFNGARLIGPGIAGVVIAYTGEGICFLINATSFLLIIVALFQISIAHTPKDRSGSELWKDLKDGYQYTFGIPSIRLFILVLSAISLLGLPFFVLLPAYAREILGGDSQTLGFLMSAAGIGALLAALFLASRSGVKGLIGIISVTLFIFGIGISLLAITSSSFIAYGLMFFCGFGMVASIAGINTLIQFSVSDEMRGRVLSFYAIALMGMNPVGSFLAGSAASSIGLKYTLLFSGITCIVTGIYFSGKRKKLENLF
jgi:MFS family permease